ncbi:GntR family transcriptional regulator [Streptomyces sp. NPDC008001]|uniref:GntR family transcriptional regulator n=1 Tax=Streptomyces sp. NPDC008001 TaxID=3364804 RepID=UPI0036E4F2C2
MAEHAIDRRAPKPPFQQIAEDIIRDIEAGKLEVDRSIPSAPELMNRYGVARATAQRALGHLVAEGYAYAIPKRGTYIKARKTEAATD